jgi:hypothetical protein
VVVGKVEGGDGGCWSHAVLLVVGFLRWGVLLWSGEWGT